MQRREFLKQACGAGLCGCAVTALFAPKTVAGTEEAKVETKPAPKPAAKAEDGRIRFAQDRYAAFLTALSNRADAAAIGAALEEVGGFCAGSSKLLASFAGKPDEFLAMIREKWHAQADFDRERGIVALAFPAQTECPCALVKKGVTPPAVCQCSIGWQKRTFGTVFGRPVEVTLKSSLLRGAERCTFEVRLA